MNCIFKYIQKQDNFLIDKSRKKFQNKDIRTKILPMNKTLLGTTSIILLHRCRYRNESCLEKVLPTFQCDTIQNPNRKLLQGVFLAAIPMARYRTLIAFFAAVVFSMSPMRLFSFVSVVWLIHLLRCYFWPFKATSNKSIHFSHSNSGGFAASDQ